MKPVPEVKRCTWGCKYCHVHSVRAPWPANTPEPLTVCQHVYCTNPACDAFAFDAPEWSEPYRLFHSPHAHMFHPKPTGRMASVEWGARCLLEPEPEPTLF